ncbi:hypothetical protein HY643_00565 [Candidatus Woesearchaeota archaeon]|nr:hypothetical protein [Candidatus Woesearchaeota archaeon]
MTSRPGLYAMVLMTMLSAWRIQSNLEKVLDQVDRTNNRIEQINTRIGQIEKAFELQVRDVIGEEAPEKFFEINGQRVYLEIDGKPIDQYFRK